MVVHRPISRSEKTRLPTSLCFILTDRTLEGAVSLRWLGDSLLRFVLFLDCVIKSTGFYLSFVHCFPFLHFANYPVYKFNISLF